MTLFVTTEVPFLSTCRGLLHQLIHCSAVIRYMAPATATGKRSLPIVMEVRQVQGTFCVPNIMPSRQNNIFISHGVPVRSRECFIPQRVSSHTSNVHRKKGSVFISWFRASFGRRFRALFSTLYSSSLPCHHFDTGSCSVYSLVKGSPNITLGNQTSRS